MAKNFPNTPDGIAAMNEFIANPSPQATPMILHVRTEIKTTFVVPDGHGNAVERSITLTVPQLTNELWREALARIRAARDEAAEVIRAAANQE